MPGILKSTSSSSRSSEQGDSDGSRAAPERSYLRDDYPAASTPNYSEKPLDEQLEPIAVVGMGCRLPGDVSSASDFWDMLMNKRSGQNPKVPANRFNVEAHYHRNKERPGSLPVMGGYFINEDLENFDPGLFNITPVEAMWMDPQQRKLCEVVYEAFESGGISLDAIAGSRTGVFAASFTADWQQMSMKEPSFRHTMAATGVDPGILSDRISYVFNLNGPSIVCNTACSSSIYALHNACIALRNDECDGAVVGGTNLVFTIDQQMNTAKIGVLSPRGTCFTFDESADGYGRAEGVGAVYLKRLSDAVRDGDPIRAVLRGSSVNHNGRVSSASISYPGVNGQAYVMADAYKRSGNLDPMLTGYFECHGTGTAVGDPIEVEAIGRAMNHSRRPGVDDKLMIGAVKTNVGHGEAASGLTALIKAVLIVERGIIPPTIGIKKLTSKIKWDEWQVQVPVEPTPFPSHLPMRRVSVNTCGYGGTNAHVIVEEAGSILRLPQTYKFVDNHILSGLSSRTHTPRRAAHRKRPFLLPFSAHDKTSLRQNIVNHGKVAGNYNLLDLSYTLGCRRSTLTSKAFTVASYNTLGDSFENIESSFTFADKKRPQAPTVGFVFTGQGAQWPRMGAELLQYSPNFLQSIRGLDRALDELHDGPEWAIEDLLVEDETISRVHEAEFSQPLCTAVQIGLVDLLSHWGIRPVVTVGHSSGEIAASYAAGLVSAKEAITAAYYRGKVTKDVKKGGAMMAVGLGAEAAELYLASLAGNVVVACHNSPSLVTLSGDDAALQELKTKFEAENIFARFVKTNGKAYHSHYMIPVAKQYEVLFQEARKKSFFDKREKTASSNIRMVSSVTNTIFDENTVIDETYWSANLQSPVLFNQAVHTILKAEEFSDVDLLIEVGPHSAMAGPIKQIKAALKAEKLEYASTLLRGQDSAVQLLKLAGEMYLRSYPLQMERVTAAYASEAKGGKGSVIVDLPHYSWNYSRQFWPESRASKEHRHATHPRHDVLGQLVIGASPLEPTWRNVLRIRDLPWLKDHSLGGEAVFPAAGYFSMAVEAITQLNERSGKPVGIDNYVLRDVSIKKALVTPDNDDGIEVITNMRHSIVFGDGWWDFSVSSVDAEGTIKDHMAGSIGINTTDKTRTPRTAPEFTQRATGRAWNQALREVGFDYGPTFQDMEDIRFDGKRYEASSATSIKQTVDESLGESRHALHPAVVDSTLQLSIVAIYAGRTNAMDCGVVPVQVDEVTIWPPTPEQLAAGKASAYAWVDRRGIRSFENSVQMTAGNGEMVMEIVNVRTTSYEAAVPQKDESALLPAPYGEMAWQYDIQALMDTGKANEINPADLASLALFKYPSLKVFHVCVGSHAAHSLLTQNPRAHWTLAIMSGGQEDLEEAKEALTSFPNAHVVGLDLSLEPEEQGLAAGSYDLVLARTDLIDANLHRLAKPNGFIISFVGQKSHMTKVPGPPAAGANGHLPHNVQVVYRKSPGAGVSHAQSSLEGLGWTVKLSKLESFADASNIAAKHVVMLTDFEGPLLSSITQTEFVAIQNVTNTATSLLWVTNGGLLEGEQPEHAMVSGLARSVRAEQASLDFRTIDVDAKSSPLEITRAITRVAQLQYSKIEEVPENEFCLAGGMTYISRLVRNNALNEKFSSSAKAQLVNYSPKDRISGKVVHGKVMFEEQVADQNAIKPSHVEVQVQYSGLTRESVLVVTGSDYPTTFSHAIGGVVTKCGEGVTSLKPGDKVVGLNVDKFSSYQEVPANMLQKVTSNDRVEKLVSLLMPYAAALYGLDTLARVAPKETILVLHNTGAIGVAAIKVAEARGATAYIVAKTNEEIDFLSKTLGLPQEQIIQSSVSTVSSQIEKLTNGHGADIVFSAGSAIDSKDATEAWRCIGRFGRFVDAGRKDVLSRNALDTFPTRRGALYMPFDMLDLLEARPEAVATLIPVILDMFKNSSIVPPGVIETVNLGDLDQAVSAYSDACGAVMHVIRYTESPIRIIPRQRAKLSFSPDVTYLLVGCLGGLGRSLTSWMMESGARRFAFLSRSGTDAPSAARLLRDIEAAGAIVQVVRGDATNRGDVVRAVQEIPTAHPIKGVVHAAMVLRDALFHSMTFDSWKTSVEPKVVGAMNLHSVLANTDLDFFLMTSSVSGVLGTPGQGNYAAANSYLDSLARHRMRQGQSAVASVIPMVLGVGVVSENTELEDNLRRKGMYGIDEEHLLQSFEASMVASSTKERLGLDHVVIGLDPVLLQKAVNDQTATDSFWVEDVRFNHVVHAMSSSKSAASGGHSQNILGAIKSAASPADAVGLVTSHLTEKLSRMLLLPEDSIDALSGSIASYGVDSMIGAELRNWIFKEYRLDIPFQQLLAATLTINKFAKQVCESAGVVVP
ncbi:KR domain-containing protein [Colletotrichum graminicola]|uniref:KR domain-containing protein n=1 Tax=Colletotrichum graminicola (strain M1.001 / M2 / FGSC 10212) TaxID=645133 RepID=E3QYL0_COLGM|nr:KR domain-containing protein [Colletotrichum graminicola M1.001]EFQ35948.1 KR domain-containing protein [Colletotrichum graminicola M1.001]WDK16362.1 KR domain-containing protein [Colletotrichum graminicola]